MVIIADHRMRTPLRSLYCRKRRHVWSNFCTTNRCIKSILGCTDHSISFTNHLTSLYPAVRIIASIQCLQMLKKLLVLGNFKNRYLITEAIWAKSEALLVSLNHLSLEQNQKNRLRWCYKLNRCNSLLSNFCPWAIMNKNSIKKS